MCIPPKEFGFTQTGRATLQVGVKLVINELEPLHARVNTLLVYNLINILYEVSDVYWIVLWNLLRCCRTTASRLICRWGLE